MEIHDFSTNDLLCFFISSIQLCQVCRRLTWWLNLATSEKFRSASIYHLRQTPIYGCAISQRLLYLTYVSSIYKYVYIYIHKYINICRICIYSFIRRTYTNITALITSHLVVCVKLSVPVVQIHSVVYFTSDPRGNSNTSELQKVPLEVPVG